jgi:hypothetical protein
LIDFGVRQVSTGVEEHFSEVTLAFNPVAGIPDVAQRAGAVYQQVFVLVEDGVEGHAKFNLDLVGPTSFIHPKTA